MNERDKNEIAKLLNHDPAHVDRAKLDYVLYTVKNIPIPRLTGSGPIFLVDKSKSQGRRR